MFVKNMVFERRGSHRKLLGLIGSVKLILHWRQSTKKNNYHFLRALWVTKMCANMPPIEIEHKVIKVHLFRPLISSIDALESGWW